MDHRLTMRFGALYKLSEEDRLDICQQIAEACEKSFRRGFSHGIDSDGGDVVVDIMKWRFVTPLAQSVSPHGTYSSSAIARHTHEVGLPSFFDQPETQT